MGRSRARSIQRGRIHRFIAVGCAAALVHWTVVIALVSHLGWQPIIANLAGWIVAFGVSFTGHYRWTFGEHGASAGAAFRRFFAVSAAGFLINESAYAVMLRWSGVRYDALLAVVLLGVAVLTYWLSRHWAFLRSQGP